MMMTTTPEPMDLLSALVLDTGRRWGESAVDFQRDDAAAVLDNGPDAPRLHFLTRPRGGSKTTDAAGLVLAALITQAPARSTSHAFARDRDQAGRLVDVIGGLVARTGLAGLVDVGTWSVTVRGSEARLVVESADAGSAYGALPWLVVVDELAQWPTTRGARSLWEAIVSGLPKRADSRLVAITSAGDPAHWSAKVIENARTSQRWRVSEVPGPLPWISPDDLAEQAHLLPPSAYARLHLNQWTSGEDRLVSAEDLRACVTLDGPLDPTAGRRYRIGLDLGLKNDRTVLTVCHADQPGPRVVLDRIHVLQGTTARPVQLGDVETLALATSRAYGHAPIRLDPWQAVGLAQRLRAAGVRVEEWAFTPVSVGRLAMNLFTLLREHRLALPADEELLDELGTVRLRETTAGVFRLDHDSGHHDDRAVALGLAALALTEKPAAGALSVAVPTARIDRGGTAGMARTLNGARSRARIAANATPTAAELRAAGRRQPRGVNVVLGVKGAWDDPSNPNDPRRAR